MKTLPAIIIAVTLISGTALTGGSAAAAPGQRSGPHTGCALPVFGPGADYHPTINPSDFSPNVDNPWFPLKPGTTFVYQGRKDGETAVDIFAPSHRTKLIDGVQTRVVNDRLVQNGVLEERTTDYYAQDRCGNVWYFGEDTAELDRYGHVVSRAGSFHAGVNGAQPGVYMQAHPTLGRTFRQEWDAGNAEDQFSAIDKHADITVPYGTFHNALRTKETTALEPGVLDNKVYVRGLGQVLEVTLHGGDERFSLVDVLR
jgi:hypothetical protein